MRLLIDGATVWNGTGAAPFPGKVLVEGERIIDGVARRLAASPGTDRHRRPGRWPQASSASGKFRHCRRRARRSAPHGATLPERGRRHHQAQHLGRRRHGVGAVRGHRDDRCRGRSGCRGCTRDRSPGRGSRSRLGRGEARPQARRGRDLSLRLRRRGSARPVGGGQGSHLHRTGRRPRAGAPGEPARRQYRARSPLFGATEAALRGDLPHTQRDAQARYPRSSSVATTALPPIRRVPTPATSNTSWFTLVFRPARRCRRRPAPAARSCSAATSLAS